MKIIADENIPYLREFFSNIGDIETYPGRDITSDCLQDADILLVRSITPVNEILLDGTSVQFVGTVSAGINHVDTDYLQSQKIHFSNAMGANANAVAEYVFAAIFSPLLDLDFSLRKPQTLGIIGVGAIGSRVAMYAERFGFTVLRNDPIKATQSTPSLLYTDLKTVLTQSDIVTLHVPLTTASTSAYPTRYLIGEKELSLLKKNAILINMARGGIVQESALKKALDRNLIEGAVIDVWENEPAIDTRLLEKVTIATPHVAGHSIDGKAAGVRMIYKDLCRFLHISPKIPGAWLPSEIEQTTNSKEISNLINRIKKAAQIEEDDHLLRQILTLPPKNHSAYFDHIRNTYRIRKEAN